MAGYTIKEWAPGERPRERLDSLGATALTTRELVALLVGSGSEGRSALDVAEDMLRQADGSLRRLASRPTAELMRVRGVGMAVAGRVSAALELGRRLAREGPLEQARIRTPADIYERCAPGMRDLLYEEFRILLVNTQHAIVREQVITRGTLDASIVHAREVFRAAIVECAAAVILVHNHPSGDPTPSRADIAVTQDIKRAGAPLGVTLHDHVIIGRNRHVSLRDLGLI